MNVAGFIMFFCVLLVVLGGLNVQFFRWAKKLFRLRPASGRLLKAVQWASVAGMILGRVADRIWLEPPVRLLLAVSSTIQLTVIISAILLLVLDLGLLVVRLLSRQRSAVTSPSLAAVGSAQVESMSAVVGGGQVPAAAITSELPRRAFIAQAAAGSAFLIGSSSSLYGALSGRHDYSIEEVPLKIPGLKRQLDGFSIVQLSDVHIGVFVGDAELATAESLVRQAKPDLVVLTGDLLDNDARLAHRLARFVRRLEPLAKYGVVAITGNHDFYAGIGAYESAIRGGGGRLLRNQAEIIGDADAGFALLGVDDVWARRQGGGPDLERAVRGLPRLNGKLAPAQDLPRILLCHNPSYFKQAAGRVAAQLSGHTHGGQVNVGIRPADYLLPGGWVAGEYQLNGSQLYVNRGFGVVGPPARVGAAPEVTRIVLSAGA
jgi:predicted MPP superfamily phosphohydrolase